MDHGLWSCIEGDVTRSINGMAERFRARMAEPRIVALPGCFDALSAILSQEAGFEAVFLSGYGVAASSFGNPDIGLTSLTETAQFARNVVTAVNVPVVVDVDNGYGNEENVSRTIYEMEAAGVAAIQLEDQVFPKRCGHSDGKKVLPLPLYLQKLEAAMRARQTDLWIIARTDSPDLDDALMRARAFMAAGADAIIIDGLRDMTSVQRAAAEVVGPKQLNLINGGKTPLLTTRQAQELGFNILLYSTPTLYTAVQAMRRWLPILRETGDLAAISEGSCEFTAFQEFIEAQYRQRKHLKGNS